MKSITPVMWLAYTLLLGILITIPAANCQSEVNNTILVVYPESSSAHQKLYDKIVSGMRSTRGATIISQAYKPTAGNEDVQALVDHSQAHAIIAIGPQGRKLADQIEMTIPVVSGAHVLARDNQSAISLAADPMLQFAKLKQLKPAVRTVYVVHNKENTGWLIDEAKIASRKFHLELVVKQVDAVDQIAGAVKEIVTEAKPNQSAIWLPLDPILPVKLLLPDLLKAAWDKNLVVFSNNPVDVQKGALFAMYPDYSQIGRQMVETVMARIDGKIPARPESCRYLNSAVNSRMASHLGINLNTRNTEFNLYFPERL